MSAIYSATRYHRRQRFDHRPARYGQRRGWGRRWRSAKWNRGSNGTKQHRLAGQSLGHCYAISSTEFSISDGSGATITVEVPAGVSVPAAGSYISVTGIITRQETNGVIDSVIEVRTAGDITQNVSLP